MTAKFGTIVFLVLSLSGGRATHSCAHDAYLKTIPKATNTVGAMQAYGRRLAGGTAATAPLRIKAVFVGVDTSNAALTAATVSLIRTTLVPAAIARWSSLLATIPVEGPLFAMRDLVAYYDMSVGPALPAVYAAVTGCANTAADVPIFFNATMFGSQASYDEFGRPTQASYDEFGRPIILSEGAGFPNTDTVIFVTAKQTPMCGSSGTVAYATSCQRDQYDRPTFGRMNLCPNAMSTAPEDRKEMLSIVIHELNHALGFSSDSWPLHRYSDAARSPKTPRDRMFPTNVDAAYVATYRCAGSQYSRETASAATTAYFAERGMAKCDINALAGGRQDPSNCVLKAVGSAVVAAGRVHFACPTLNGVELENQLTSQCELQGSHWEQRLFSTEVMASYVQHESLISPVTLAMHEDSGWYVANYSNADTFRPGDWGWRQGCSFATEKCLSLTAHINTSPPHFIPANKPYVCTTDRRAVGQTSLSSFSSLPAQYRYFTDPSVGGSSGSAGHSATSDFCPAIEAYSNGRCSDGRQNPAFGVASPYGQFYGSKSACFENSLFVSSVTSSSIAAGCYGYACVNSTAINIFVGARFVQCRVAGRAMTVPGYSGVLICPDAAVLCSTPVLWVPATSLVNGSGMTTSSGSDKTSSGSDKMWVVGIVLGVCLLVGFSCGAYADMKRRRTTAAIFGSAPSPFYPGPSTLGLGSTLGYGQPVVVTLGADANGVAYARTQYEAQRVG